MMKYPLWIINTALIGIVLFNFIIFRIINRRQPIITSISLPKIVQDHAKTNVINKDLIYHNDIFGTYHEQQQSLATVAIVSPLPKPPVAKKLYPIVKPVPHFLPPLSLTLRGVMALITEEDNIAIIEDSQSKITKNYKVGDKIGDGYVLRIARNAFSVLRSNGQQETLYVNAKDPELLHLLQGQDWSGIIKHQHNNIYALYYHEFIKYVPYVAKFIELFNLSTVYNNGKHIGCRIGKPPQPALIAAAGLEVGDIIVLVDQMPVGSVEERLELIDHVYTLHDDATLTIDFIRNNQKYRSLYILKSVTKDSTEQTDTLLYSNADEELQENKQKVLNERYVFASQLQKKKKYQDSMHDVYQQQLRRGQGNISSHVRTS